MRRIARRGVVALVLGVLVSTLGGPAGAVERISFFDPIDETFTDIGCTGAETEIHTMGWARGTVVESDGLFLIQVSISLTQSWTETVAPFETFSGRVSGPFSFRVLPSGGETFSDVFTAIARGDMGTTALFKARLHATVDANGQMRVEFERLSGGCM